MRACYVSANGLQGGQCSRTCNKYYELDIEQEGEALRMSLTGECSTMLCLCGEHGDALGAAHAAWQRTGKWGDVHKGWMASVLTAMRVSGVLRSVRPSPQPALPEPNRPHTPAHTLPHAPALAHPQEIAEGMEEEEEEGGGGAARAAENRAPQGASGGAGATRAKRAAERAGEEEEEDATEVRLARGAHVHAATCPPPPPPPYFTSR